MKKIILTLALAALCSANICWAQNNDAERFANAPRKELSLPKGASGYTVERVELFGSKQTISVISYSPKHLTTTLVLPEKLTPLSKTAQANDASFGVNAGYWDVRIDLPSTFLQLNGKQISKTASARRRL